MNTCNPRHLLRHLCEMTHLRQQTKQMHFNCTQAASSADMQIGKRQTILNDLE
jgi:hypothetical protein